MTRVHGCELVFVCGGGGGGGGGCHLTSVDAGTFWFKRPRTRVLARVRLLARIFNASTERIGLVVAAAAAAGCMDLVWGLQRLIQERCQQTQPCACVCVLVLMQLMRTA